MTSAFLYHVMHLVNITIDIRHVCVFLAPLFSSFTVLVTYHLTKELKDASAGLVAAAMIAIVPGYISRSLSPSCFQLLFSFLYSLFFYFTLSLSFLSFFLSLDKFFPSPTQVRGWFL